MIEFHLGQMADPAERKNDLAALPAALVQYGEPQFLAEARTEMQQHEASLVHQSATERHEVLRASAIQLQQ